MPVLFYASLAYSNYLASFNSFQVCWDVPTGHDVSSSNTGSMVSTISHQFGVKKVMSEWHKNEFGLF